MAYTVIFKNKYISNIIHIGISKGKQIITSLQIWPIRVLRHINTWYKYLLKLYDINKMIKKNALKSSPETKIGLVRKHPQQGKILRLFDNFHNCSTNNMIL